MMLKSKKKYFLPNEAPNGVYCVSSDKKLWPLENWDTSHNQWALGVALITDKCRFLINNTNRFEKTFKWGERDSDIPGINVLELSSASDAKQDYNGLYNTQKIVAFNTGEHGDDINSYAAGYCYNANTGTGLQGYLGSVGEFVELGKHVKQINECLKVMRMYQIYGYYWSSNPAYYQEYTSSWPDYNYAFTVGDGTVSWSELYDYTLEAYEEHKTLIFSKI